jgi:hypothetical protein
MNEAGPSGRGPSRIAVVTCRHLVCVSQVARPTSRIVLIERIPSVEASLLMRSELVTKKYLDARLNQFEARLESKFETKLTRVQSRILAGHAQSIAGATSSARAQWLLVLPTSVMSQLRNAASLG